MLMATILMMMVMMMSRADPRWCEHMALARQEMMSESMSEPKQADVRTADAQLSEETKDREKRRMKEEERPNWDA